MRVKSTKKITSKTKSKNINQLELKFKENIKNKKNTNISFYHGRDLPEKHNHLIFFFDK